MATLDVIFIALAVLTLILAGLLLWDTVVSRVTALDDKLDDKKDLDRDTPRAGTPTD